MTDYEYVMLYSTVEAMHEKNWNCYDCKKQFDHIPKPELRKEHLTKARQIKGCFTFEHAKEYGLENIAYRTCIGNFFDKSVVELVEMFNKYDQGVLPFEGPMADQPSKVIEVFKMIDSIRGKKAEEQRKKEEAKNKAMGSKRKGKLIGKR